MEKKSPADKLLEATGVQKRTNPLEELRELRKEMISSFDAVMAQAEKALDSAQKMQCATDQMFCQLKTFCSETWPAQMTRALEKIGEEGVRECLSPMQASVQKMISDIEECRGGLTFLGWTWRVVMWPFVSGMVGACVGACVMLWAGR